MIGLLTAAPTHAPGVISFTIEQLWQMILSIAGGITAISAAVVVQEGKRAGHETEPEVD